MRAITIIPRTPHSAQLRDVPKPALESVANGRGVLVKIIRVGVDGTDHELQDGLYGAPPSRQKGVLKDPEKLRKLTT